jgi:selenocysteine-specific elongation factor
LIFRSLTFDLKLRNSKKARKMRAYRTQVVRSLLMRSIIVGTAGHIDHGKTALVRALTGIDADRLPEEKRRGITIDIGFADLDLTDVRIGFIDVPGHERFVKNMLAGAHGIDVVALVIAADESVMPQTREHFDICRLLGVNRGLIVLTKKDLADDDLLQLAQLEAEEMVRGSFLEGAQTISVSSRTGEGIEELKSALRELGVQVPARSPDFVPRLAVDRAFTMRGFGAVVTGTLIAGEINEGDELELLPGDNGAASTGGSLARRHLRVRVRGLQVHGAEVKRATAGQRTAINLGGIETAAIERGMVLAPVGRLRPTQIVDASVRVLPDSPRPLRSRQRIRVHIGAAEALARLRVLDVGGEIKPGAAGFVQLRMEAPVVGVLGDRFIIRAYSPQVTVGGGVILDPFARKHRARELPDTRAALTKLAGGDRNEQVTQFVVNAGKFGLKPEELAARTAWTDETLTATVAGAVAAGVVIRIDDTLVAREAFAELKRQVLDAISAHHKREPLSRGLAKEVLREQVFGSAPTELFRGILNQLEQDQSLLGENEIVRLREHTRELSAGDARLRDALEKVYRDAALSAPTLNDAFAQAGLASNPEHARKLLQLLLDAGTLVRVHGDMIFHKVGLVDLEKRLRAFADSHAERAIDVAAFKDLAGISRKYAIPLLEYFDRKRVTRREGDKRVVL